MVGDGDRGEVDPVGRQPVQCVHEILVGREVEGVERFVEQEQRRIGHQARHMRIRERSPPGQSPKRRSARSLHPSSGSRRCARSRVAVPYFLHRTAQCRLPRENDGWAMASSVTFWAGTDAGPQLAHVDAAESVTEDLDSADGREHNRPDEPKAPLAPSRAPVLTGPNSPVDRVENNLLPGVQR